MESKDRVTYKLLKKYYEENKNNIEMCGLKCKFDNENVCEPGKIKIDNNSNIRRKRAGFDFAGNSKISEQIQNLLNNMNVKTKINGMNFKEFKKTKQKYKSLKNKLDKNFKQFRRFIKICCENLEIDSKGNLKSLKFKNNKDFNNFNKKLAKLDSKYVIDKNDMDKIKSRINDIIKEFEDSIKKLRDNLFNQNENPNKYYIEFSAKLEDLISKIDKKLEIIGPQNNEFKKVVEDLILQVANNEDANEEDDESPTLIKKFNTEIEYANEEDDESAPLIKKFNIKKFNIENYNSEKTLEFIKQGLKLESDYLMTKDKRDKENNTKLIDENEEYNSLKEYLYISDYYAESELKRGGKYVEIDGNKEKVMDQIFGIKKPSDKSDNEWKPDIKQWNPDIDDIQQGNIGDCYLLAALQSVCESNREQYIKDCFVNFENIYDDHYVEFQFYKLKLEFKRAYDGTLSSIQAKQDGKASPIIVNTTVLQKYDKKAGNKSGKLWVNLFEKAYASYKTNRSNFNFDDNSKDLYESKNKEWIKDEIEKNVSAKFALGDVEAGNSFIPLAAITGKEFKFLKVIQDNDINTIRKGDIISFKNLSKWLYDQNQGEDNVEYLMEDHAYSILDISKDYVVLKNPWNDKNGFDLGDLGDLSKVDKDTIDELLFISVNDSDNSKENRGTIHLKRAQITKKIVKNISKS